MASIKSGWRKIAVLCLSILTAGAFTCCAEKQPSTSALNEDYEKTAETRFTVWTYQTEFNDMSQTVRYYNGLQTDGKRVEVVEFSPDEYSPELFSEKLSAAIMSGKGPDFVVCNTLEGLAEGQQYFQDVAKTVGSGKFSPWDEIRENADFKQLDYFDSVWEAAAYTDGRVYALPLEVNYYFIETMEETMKQFDIKAADFADSESFLQMLTRIQEQTGQIPCCGDPGIETFFSSIYDYSNQKTGLLSEPQFSAVQRWNTLFFDGPDTAGCRLFHGYDTEVPQEERIAIERYTYDADLQHEFLAYPCNIIDTIVLHEETMVGGEDRAADNRANYRFYPLCDENGDWVGDVTAYGVVTQNSKCKDEVFRFITWYINNRICNSEISPCSTRSFEKVEFLYEQAQEGFGDDYYDLLKNHPKRLQYCDAGAEYMRECLESGISGQKSFDQVETDLNIYLSE